jgi:hypothetical protein
MYHQMPLDTKKKYIYGIGVGISIAFEIFNNFPFLEGEGVDPPGAISIVLQIMPVTQ